MNGVEDRRSPNQRRQRGAATHQLALELPGVGRCEAISVPIDDPSASRLVLARHSADGFDPEEANLLRGMARVLALTLRTIRVLEAERAVRQRSEAQGQKNLRLLASLRERQKLLERLSRIQRSIVSRSALEDVLESIVGGARELLGDEVVGLRLVDESDPSQHGRHDRRQASTIGVARPLETSALGELLARRTRATLP
jgi:hypothetical protein